MPTRPRPWSGPNLVRGPRSGVRAVACVVVGALIALLLGAGGWPALLPAHAAAGEADVEVRANVTDDGRIAVRKQLTFPEAAPDSLTLTLPTAQPLGDARTAHYTYSGIEATIADQPAPSSLEEGRRATTLHVDTAGAQQVTLAYTVSGAVGEQPGQPGTVLAWPVVGGLDIPVREAEAVVQATGFSFVRCTAGPPGSTIPCRTAMGGTHVAEQPTFQHAALAPGDSLVANIGFAPGQVASSAHITEGWTFARAFSVAAPQLGLALAVLVLGGAAVGLFTRRVGGDHRLEDSAEGIDIATFEQIPATAPGEPVTHDFVVHHGLRPGLIGVLADDRVDPIDITAELIDLAVRGHLHIEELPHTSQYAAADWRLTRTEEPGDDLADYERSLLDMVAPAQGGAKVSDLGHEIAANLGQVQGDMYAEVVRRGWFDHRPDDVRTRWTIASRVCLAISVVVLAVLVGFTSWGLLGVALVLVSVLMMLLVDEMPARTRRGSQLLAGVDRLYETLHTEPTNRMPPGRELAELSEVLPWAVVLGSSERWLHAVAARELAPDRYDAALGWYSGPPDWDLSDAPASLDHFITSMSGLIARG